MKYVLLLFLCLAGPALALPVFKVVHVEGAGVTAKEGDLLSGGQEIRTDAKSSVLLELTSGGLIFVKPGSHLKILDEHKVHLHTGGMWARFATQLQPFRIETQGGSLAIKGTEFVVDTSEGGEGQVTLAEGKVDYVDHGNRALALEPGQQLSQVSQDGQLVSLTGLPWEVQKAVDDVHSGKLKLSALDEVALLLESSRTKYLKDELNSARNKLENIERKMDHKRAYLGKMFEDNYTERIGTVPTEVAVRMQSWNP